MSPYDKAETMTGQAASPAAPPRAAWGLGSGLLLLLAAVAIRAIQFGNPTVHVDEQFYLFAGDRLLRGELPFTDIWDRKPFGLFAVYAAIRLVGGDGILAYQLAATLAAAATAALIARMSLRLTNATGATIAGIAYLLWLMIGGGDGGQAPVFYNLVVAGAALLVVQVQERRGFGAAAVARASAAMALCGIAIQIKYTTVFEGCFFGCWLIGLALRRHVRVVGVAALAAGWCLLALLPTAAVAALYWRLGHLDDFVFANFVSIFQRSSADYSLVARLADIALRILVPAAVAVLAVATQRRAEPVVAFVRSWALAAIAGLLLFGTYHYHYCLPLLVPLTIVGAPVYGDAGRRLAVRGRGISVRGIALLLGAVMAIGFVLGSRASRGTGEAVRAVAQRVGRSPPGCIFVFAGDPILYHLTDSCLPTRFTFPSLLSDKPDARSLGVDQLTELRRTMASRPDWVFVREPMLDDADLAAWRFMATQLATHYRPAFRAREGHSVLIGYTRVVRDRSETPSRRH